MASSLQPRATQVIFFRPPEALFRLSGYRATGVQLFRDYVRASGTVDPKPEPKPKPTPDPNPVPNPNPDPDPNPNPNQVDPVSCCNPVTLAMPNLL